MLRSTALGYGCGNVIFGGMNGDCRGELWVSAFVRLCGWVGRLGGGGLKRDGREAGMFTGMDGENVREAAARGRMPPSMGWASGLSSKPLLTGECCGCRRGCGSRFPTDLGEGAAF